MSRDASHGRAPHGLGSVALALTLAGSPGCRSDTAAEREPAPVVVFAASSLREAMTELEHAFEREHPEIDLRPSFAGSQVLRLQLEHGARAQVFASANADHLRALADAELVAPGEPFARNTLALITPLDNPAQIESFADLPRAERLVIGAAEVPIGAYTDALFDRLEPGLAKQLRARVVSRESNVRLVRAKVELGEADAAIVYQTDAAASTRVRTIPLPSALSPEALYLIAPVRGASHSHEAATFVAFVRGPQGQAILASHGFMGAP